MSHVSVMGSPYWAKYIAENVLSQDFSVSVVSSLRELVSSKFEVFSSRDVVVLGHGIPDSFRRFFWFSIIVLVWALGGKRPHFFLYWIGSEVDRPAKNWQVNLYRWFCSQKRVHVICGAEWFVKVLAEKGLDASTMVFPYNVSEAKKYAEYWCADQKLVISTYLTPSHWNNSHGEWIVDLCKLYPQVTWRVIGMSREDALGGIENFDNVNLCGWVENPQEVISGSHIFIRLARRDAYAGTVRDAQVMKRVVVYTKPVDDCIVVSCEGFFEVNLVIKDIVEAFKRNDFDYIESLRSRGCGVPDFSVSAKLFTNYINMKHA